MLTLTLAILLSQSQPAVKRTTPATDDPGMVVRQVGTVNVNCTSGCSGGGSASFDGGNIGYMRMPDGGPLEVYTVNSSGGGSSYVNALIDGGWSTATIINPYFNVVVDGGAVVDTQGLSIDGGREWATDVARVRGNPTDVGSGASSTGTQRVILATDQSAVPASQSGTWNITNVSGTVSLPTGAATAANQTTLGNQTTKLNDGTDTAQVSAAGALLIDGSATTQPVSGTVTANAGTGNFTVVQSTASSLRSQTSSESNTGSAAPTQGSLSMGNTTTAAPTYTNNTANALSLTTAGALRTDSSATTQPVSGTVTANAGSGTFAISAASLPLPTGAATETTLAKIPVTQGSTTSGQSGELVQGAVTTAAPTYTTAQTSPLSLTTAGALRTDSSATTQPVSGSVSISGTASENLAQVGGNTVLTGNGVTGTGSQRVTIASDNTAFTVNAAQSGAWTVTANAGTNLNTSALATETSLAKLTQTQGSTTSGQSGTLGQTATTTAAPTYTTGTTNPLSTTTAGALRVDGSGSTQPVSGTVTANAGSGTFATNTSQVGGNATATGNGTTTTGTQRVTLSSDSTGQVTLATGANVIGSLTANQSVNLAQVGGTSTVTGGVAGSQGIGGLSASGAAKSGNPVQVGGVFNTTQPTVTTGQTVEAQSTARGGLIVATGVDTFAVSAAQSGTWNITNVSGTVSLPTGAATEATLTKLPVAQSTALGSNSGPMVQGSVTTAAPAYTTGNINPLSLTTTGDLRTRDVSDGTVGAAVPTTAINAGYSDGTNTRSARVYDVDTGGGAQYALGSAILAPNSGGATLVTSANTDNGSVGLAVYPISKFVQTSSPTSTAVTCATTATLAPTTIRTNRVTMTLYNNSSVTIYIGGSGVTTSNGLPLLPGASFTDNVEDTPYYCRVASGTADLRVMEN